MITLNLYGLKNCDTCRKARKALAAAGHTVNYIDVRLDGVPSDVLDNALAEFGDALINKKSTTWRGLDDADKQLTAQELLTTHPTLMKRPLIQKGDKMTIGWTNDVQVSYD
jgi:arsenate reductase